MSHPLLNAAIRVFCTSLLLIASVEIVCACICPPTPTVLDAYETANTVMIVRVLSIRDPRGLAPVDTFAVNARLLTVRVERVYKGDTKVNETLTLTQGSPGNCAWSFNETEVNSEILFYMKDPKDPNNRWSAFGCGRSKPVSQATDDLAYLDNVEKVRGKTRVSGQYGAWVNRDIAVAHRRIQIAAETDGKVYETFTDEKGFFEVYDLPPGKYRLEPEIPEGRRIDRFLLRYSISTIWRQTTSKAVMFLLNPGKHAGVNIAFQPDNAVEGRIVGPKGDPLANTCAYLRRPEDILGDIIELFKLGSLARDCTDENGRFRIESVKPGNYVLVLNVAGKPRSHEPFPRVFAPGTTELDKAAIISVALGQTVKDVNVTVPVLLETITVAGVLYRSDGQPIPRNTVNFEANHNPEIEGFVTTETDEQGRFSLKILKGVEGSVQSGMTVHTAGFRDCPEVEAMVKLTRQETIYVRTQDIKIDGDKDLSNLVLRLFYPSCTIK